MEDFKTRLIAEQKDFAVTAVLFSRHGSYTAAFTGHGVLLGIIVRKGETLYYLLFGTIFVHSDSSQCIRWPWYFFV